MQWPMAVPTSSTFRIGHRLVLSLRAALPDGDHRQADTHQHRSADDQRDVLGPFLHGVRDQRKGGHGTGRNGGRAEQRRVATARAAIAPPQTGATVAPSPSTTNPTGSAGESHSAWPIESADGGSPASVPLHPNPMISA